MPAWNQLLDDYFGKHLTQQDADRWWQELSVGDNSIRGITPDEISTAIHDAAADPNVQTRERPTLKTLRVWIFMARKARGSGRTLAGEDNHDSVINFLKTKIRDAMQDGDRVLVWDLICGAERLYPEQVPAGIPENWCAELHRWAEAEFGWVRPTPQELYADMPTPTWEQWQSAGPFQRRHWLTYRGDVCAEYDRRLPVWSDNPRPETIGAAMRDAQEALPF